jgi:hypothetical protein
MRILRHASKPFLLQPSVWRDILQGIAVVASLGGTLNMIDTIVRTYIRIQAVRLNLQLYP